MLKKIISSNIKKNKVLTSITIMSVVVSSVLIFVIGITFSSVRDYLIKEVKENVGDHHVVADKTYIKDTSKIEKIEIIDNKSYITFSDPSKVYDYAPKICNKKCKYNETLLALYGSSPNNILVKIALFILFVVSLFAFFSIKNIFDIRNSVNLKEYSILNTLGVLKKDVLRMTFLESMILGIVGIILGFCLSLVLTNLLLLFFNSKFEKINLTFQIYPFFIFVSLFFILITLVLSALLPVVKISKNNLLKNMKSDENNVYIKHKKMILEWFGIEGLLSYVNCRRSKKKYKVVTRCIWISVTLISSFYLLFSYVLNITDEYIMKPNYDGQIVTKNQYDFKSVIKENNLKNYMTFDMCMFKTKIEKNAYYNEENYHDLINIMIVNYDKEKTFLLNKVNENIITEEKLVHYDNPLLKKKVDINLDKTKIKNVSLNENIPKFLETYTTSSNVVMNVPNLECEKSSVLIYNGKMDVSKIKTEFEYYDAKKAVKIVEGIFFALKLFIFIFMFFILLIIFNSVFGIATGKINVQKKEFGILKTIGFSDLKFIQMLFYESVLVFMKGFIISVILVSLISNFLYYSVSLVIDVSYISPYYNLFKFSIYNFFMIFGTHIFVFYFINNKTINQNIVRENI